MIKLDLDEILKKNNINQKKLASMLGISEVTLSRKINGVISTNLNEVNEMCTLLNCRVEDIIKYIDTSKKIIPIFMNYNGIGDLLIENGEKYLNSFFNKIKKLESITNCSIKVIMISCMDIESCKSKFIYLEEMAERVDLFNLFHAFISEYSGFIIEKINYNLGISDSNIACNNLLTISPIIAFNRSKINEICESNGFYINNLTFSYLNVCPKDGISDEVLYLIGDKFRELFKDTDIEVFVYNDKYSRDIDIKDRNNTEANAVNLVLRRLVKCFEIEKVIICESYLDDGLYSYNIDYIRSLKLGNYHIKQDKDFDINSYLDKIILKEKDKVC